MKQQIIKLLSEIRPEFDFTENVDLIENGYLDSFDIVTLVTSLDELYNISIPGVEILPENFSTIQSIIELLKKNGVNE
jgi:acyl carrier protein